MNYQLGWEIFHWRSRDGEEIDFLIQTDPQNFLFIEVKVSPTKVKPTNDLPEVRKVFKDKHPQLIVCHQEGEHQVGNLVPIAQLKDFLLKNYRLK
jgi:predicted AAA+ superfamily ATPase